MTLGDARGRWERLGLGDKTGVVALGAAVGALSPYLSFPKLFTESSPPTRFPRGGRSTALDTLAFRLACAGLGRNCVLAVMVTLFHNRKQGAGSTDKQMKSTGR